MEYLKYERELALSGADIPLAATGELAAQASWYRVMPKVFIGFKADARPYATVKPLKLTIDFRCAWYDNFQPPIDLTVIVWVLSARNLKRYAGTGYNATGFLNWNDFLQADGQTSTQFSGYTTSPGMLYFKSNYPVTQNCKVLKKFKFRMVKGIGVPWGLADALRPSFQPALTTASPTAVLTSGPLQPSNQAFTKRFSIPVPSVLRYEMEQTPSGTITNAVDLSLPINFAPVMGVGFYDNATGTSYEGGAPLGINYEMKLTYKDL